MLSSEEIDQIGATPSLTADQIDKIEPPVAHPVDNRVQTMEATRGGPPVSVSPGGDVGSQIGEGIGDVFWNHPAIQALPTLSKKQLVEAARQFAGASMSTPATGSVVPEMPSDEEIQGSKIAALATGAANSVNNAVNWFTTPQGIYTAMIPGLPAWLQRLASGYFAYHMGRQVPKAATELGTELGKNEGDRDYEKIGGLAADIVTSTGLAAMAGAHAGKAGIAQDVPPLRKFLTTEITDEYSPQQMRDLFAKVDSGEATDKEADVYRFVTSELDSPGQAFRKGVRITTTNPKVGSPFWQKYLGLEPGQRTLEVPGSPITGAPAAAQTPTGSTSGLLLPEEIDALNPEQQQKGVPGQRVGTDEVGKTQGQPGSGNSVPGSTGKPGEIAVTPKTPANVEGGQGEGAIPPGGNPVPQPAGKPIQPGPGSGPPVVPEPTVPPGPTPKPTPAPPGGKLPAATPTGVDRFEMEYKPGLGNKFSTQVGLEVSKPNDLNRLADIREQAIAKANALRATGEKAKDEGDGATYIKSIEEGLRETDKAQLAKEAIEVATNSGGWVEGSKVGGTETKLGERPMDWRKNPTIAKWLHSRGKTIGIDVTDVTKPGTKQPKPEIDEELKKRVMGPPKDAKPQEIAKALQDRLTSMAQDLAGHVKHITGTWFSAGVEDDGTAWITARGLRVSAKLADLLSKKNPELTTETWIPSGELKPKKKSPLSDQDLITIRVIESRMKVADQLGIKVDGIRDALKAFQSGDPAKIAQWPPVMSTLQALNLRIAEEERKQANPLRTLISSDQTGQQKAQAIKKLAEKDGVSLKQMQERVELEIVRMANEIAGDESQLPDQRFAQLVRLYNRQPILSARTSTSVANQAYSTPAPLAFALRFMTMVTPKTSVYDSTAGNGMLLIGSNLEMTEANEINPERAKQLEDLGVGQVTTNDATQFTPPGTFSVIHLNPPFGSIDNVNYQGYGIKRLEHIIALKALQALKPDGRAAIILGAKREEGPTARGAQWVFENYLYGHFNVVGNFEVGGDLYAKQGTKWPVRVIVIAGRKTPSTAGPQDLAPKSVARVELWSDVWAEAERIRDAVAAYRQSLVPGGKPGLPMPGEAGGIPPAESGAANGPTGGTAKTPAVGGKSGGAGGAEQTPRRKPASGGSKSPAGGTPGKPADTEVTAGEPGSGGKPAPRVEGGNEGGAQPPTNAGGTGGAPGAKPGSGGVPEPTSVDDLAGLSESDLDQLLNDALNAAKPKAAPPAPKKAPAPGGPNVPKPGPAPSLKPKSGGKGVPKIKEAAEAAAEGAKQAYEALDELFGGGTHMGALGPTFDEKTYEKAKPHFQAAWEQFKKAGRALKDFLVHIFQKYGQPVLQYIKRFVQEKQAEQVKDFQWSSGDKTKAPAPLKPKATDFQEPYQPRSEAPPFETLTPKNIAAGEHAALDALKARHGSIDNYLADRLNLTPDEVKTVMSAEQIDGAALAIDQIERGGAVIVGDETGIGKGRQGAAVIRYAIINGKIPVFFTKDPKLFTDMYGDLKDILTDLLKDPNFKPLLLGDPGKASIVDQKGNVLCRAPGSKVQQREMEKIQEQGLAAAGYNAIFSTYSQVNERNARQLFLEGLARSNPTIIILDEAHEAAGDSETSMQAAFMSGGRVKRGSGPTQRTITVPGLLNQAGTKPAMGGGVMYLSATYAKRPENMPVYFRTDLTKAARGFNEIVNAMKKGGVALQQAVSEALAKAGQYLRRERDFTGVRYDMKTVGADNKAGLIQEVDQVTDVLSQIMDFSERIRDAVQGAGGGSSTAMSQNAVDMTDFAAIVHNQVGQLLLAAKADNIVSECLEAFKNGEKPVVALMNTMESFLDQFVEDKGIQPGQPIQLRWNELLKHALKRTLRMKNKLPNGETEITMADPDEFGLGELYRAVEEAAGEVESKFPVSPIDYIIQSLAKKGFKMYELTGRESGIDYTDPETGVGTYRRFQKANKNTIVNAFNNTPKTGMLLNASGSTGLSAHASEKVIDQDPRHTIIGQPAADINVFIQTLGRTKRTGMVKKGVYKTHTLPPEYKGSMAGYHGDQIKNYHGVQVSEMPYGVRYTHLVLPLQAELRPAAMTARKMKSLNANTTAEADAAIKIDAEDLFNKYGDRVVCEYLDQHPEFQQKLNLPVDLKDDGSIEVKRDYARKFTGRMALLPDATQKAAYEDILPTYRSMIEQLKATGEYDLEIVVHSDWDGIRSEDQQLEAGPDDSSIFTSGVRLQKWNVKDTRHTPTGAEMVKEFKAKTGGREKLLATWDSVRQKGDERIAELQARLDKEQTELTNLQAKPEAEQTESEKDEIASRVPQVVRLSLQVQGATRRWSVAKDMADHIMPLVGRVIELSNAETGDVFDGMLVEIKFPSSRYTASAFRFRFMLHSPGGVAYISGAQFSPIGWQLDTSDKEIGDLKGGMQGARYERYLVTGNPIRGYTVTGGRGKMVRFKSNQGEIVTGLLMPRNWGPAQLANDPRMDLVNGRAAVHFLSNYGMDGSKSVPIECANIVRISRQGWSGRSYSISAPASRSTGAIVYLDQPLLRITGDFTKTGNRMVATVDEGDLEKIVNRISEITKKAFRPVGSADRIIPQVDESNARAKRKGSLGPSSPVPQPRGPVTAGSVEELRSALPNSGLDPQAIKLMTAFLDSPLGKMLEGVRYEISDTIANGYQGSYFQNLAEVARGANPDTGVHELLHAIWEVMPDELKAEFERLRQAHIDEYQKEAQAAGNNDLVAALDDIRENPTDGGEDFTKRGYPFALQRRLYAVSSPEEFFTHSASARFEKKIGSNVAGFWDKVKELIRSFIEAIRSAFRRRASLNKMLDKVLRGDFKPSPRAAVDAERAYAARQASLPPKGAPAPEPGKSSSDEGLSAGELETMDQEVDQALDDESVRTMVFGRQDTVRGRERIGPAERAQGAAHAAGVLAKAGLQVQPQQNGLWELVDPGFEAEIEGRRLLTLLRQEIGEENESGRTSGFLGNLLNSIVENFTGDDVTAFSQPLKEELYAVAQGERSHRGVLLAALQGFSKTVAYVARHVDVVLKRTYSDAFGGDFIRKVLNRVVTNFRDYFTEDEITAALASKPELANLIDKAMALNRRDEGNRAYRMTQSLLKPKKKKTLARLESDARALEAFRAMVEEAKRQGIEPPPNPNKPLSPVQQLMRAANPKTAAKIEKIAQEAVAQGMRNAGIMAALSAAKDQDERTDLEGRFAAGEEPSDEMIETGLDLPEFAHWRAIRDGWLGYNPVTLKLVQKLISSDFKGTRFETPEGRPPDTRLDLANLAKAPEAEVARALDAFYSKIDQTLNIAGATPETRQRVQAMIEENVTNQLEQARLRVRQPMFQAPKAGKAPLTPEQRIGQLINANLFGDPRLDVPEMVQRVAAKSAVGRLTPKAGELVRQALQTPFYRQSDLPQTFASILTDKLGIAPEQVQQAKEVFAEAFKTRFEAARKRAALQAMEALTPQERSYVRTGKALWQKLNEAINTGNFDGGDVLRQIAEAHGWHYSKASVARLKELSDKLQRLQELTPAERASAGDKPDDLVKALREKQYLTENKQLAIKREMQAIWARLTKPITLRHWWTNRQNFAAAANEFEVANLLLKVGFPIRLATHITTQLCAHTPTRAIGDALERYLADKDAGREARLWNELYTSLTTSYKATLKSLVPALQSARSAFMGRTEVRNVDRLMGGVQALERAALKADELKAQGKTVQAGVMRLLGWVRLSLRVTQALDNFQGTPAEAQELRSLVITSLRENGRTPAEAEVLADQVLGTANDAIPIAVADARRMWDLLGEERTTAELAEDARNLVKGRTHEAIRRLGLPVDDFEEKIRLLRSTIAWQERTTTGPGGVVAVAGKAATAVASHYGLPFSFARFANAFGTGINYSLMFTPFYSLANARLPGQAPSSWFATPRDRMQRRVQALLGSLFGAAIFALFATGAMVARLRWPQGKEERDQFEAAGHRPGTIEIPISEHEFIPVSMTVGPMALFAPYIAAGSAIFDLTQRRAKQQAKLDAEAQKTGLPAGKLKPIDAADLLGIAGTAGASVIMGGKTATGLASSMLQEGSFNSRKFTSAYISPLVPGLPAYQEISRMMGVNLDGRLASIWDYMVPLPGSQARAVNMLGDPVGNPNDLQRIVQVFTAGTYPGVVDANAIQANPAYAALFNSGYRPPTIDPNKGYAINGEFRPMNDSEIAKYAQVRGELLKQALSGLGASADAKSAKEVFQQANDEALTRLGVDTGTTALATARTPSATAAPAAPTQGAAPAPRARAALSPAPRQSSRGTFRSLRVGLRRPAGAARSIRGPRTGVSSLRRPAGLGVPRAPTRSTGARAGIGVGSLKPRIR